MARFHNPVVSAATLTSHAVAVLIGCWQVQPRHAATALCTWQADSGAFEPRSCCSPDGYHGMLVAVRMLQLPASV